MSPATVVLLGNLKVETVTVDGLVHEFGWSAEAAAGLDQLRELARIRCIVAVLFDPKGLRLPIRDAVEQVRLAAPRARPIACHRFSDWLDWPQLADAGAFHALAVPFDMDEIRQSLGFVRSAGLRRASMVFPLRGMEQPLDESPGENAQLRDAS